MLTSTHWGVYDVRVENGRIAEILPFDKDPDPSPIGQSLVDGITAPARVLRPAIRRGYLESGPSSRERRGTEPFVEVSWDEALDLVAGELKRVIRDHGNNAIFGGCYGWSSAGRFHHAQGQVHRFLNAIGGYVAHVGTYSLGAARTLLPRILMDMDSMRAQHTAWVQLERHCQLFVAFGGVPVKNAQVNTGGASEHHARPALKRLAAAGVKFVNVSPLRDDLADASGAEWIAIRPNTDAAFMLALAHTLITEDLHDRAFLDRYCTGFDCFRAYVLGDSDGIAKDAQWASAICAIDPQTIVALARRMGTSRTMINTAWSLQRGDHGEQPYWLTIALACLLGQIGTPGGGFALAYGPVNAEGAHASTFSGPRVPQGVNAVKQSIPVARIADMLEYPGATYDFNGERRTYPDIRLVYWAGGNPFHHHQDLNRFIGAWRRPETIVVHEQYWTASAKFADVVLPATTMLERDDIGSASRDRFMIAMKRAIDPVGESRDDYDIFAALADRLGAKEKFTEGRSAHGWLRHLYDESRERARDYGIALPPFEAFWSEGVIELPVPDEPAVMLQRFRDDPEQHRLPTPSGKIEIFSFTIDSFGYDDCAGHPAWYEPVEWLGAPLAQRFPLHLISHQPATRLHSQYDHGSVSRASKVNGREAMTIHPQDAAERGIRDGDVVRVFNDRGACLAGARLSDSVMRGVVVLPTGAWYDPLVPGAPGTLEKHGNPNVLTIDKGTSKLTQGCSAHSCLVEIERFEGEPPPVTAFEPPQLSERPTPVR
ncbi:MAG TPA: molybdopterin guanine dinucleotide-containing S/N-oxide reductase [Burkholderiales bacterium]|nr:molybdopterin guanine dinucleotide-containing S/N-oxide reductase [Burkholderiales bacterium]